MRARTGFGALAVMAAALLIAGVTVMSGDDAPLPARTAAQAHSYRLECFWVNENGDRQRQICPEALRRELVKGMGGIDLTPGQGDLGTIQLTFLETDLRPFEVGGQVGLLATGYRVDVRIASGDRSSTWDGRHVLYASTDAPLPPLCGSFAEQRDLQEARLARQLVSRLPGRFRRD